MKNQNIQFKPTAGLMIPLLLIFSMVMLTLIPAPAIAADQVAFTASFATEFTSKFVPPFYLCVSITGEGHASHMGRSSAITTDQRINLEDGTGTATYILMGVNGDTVVVAITAQDTNIPGGVAFVGDYTVIGGTGRFDEATGSGSMEGSALFSGPTSGVGSFTLAGTISSPGNGH